MSRHKVCSPSSTYFVIPSVTVSNKGQQQSEKAFDLKNPILLTKFSQKRQQNLNNPEQSLRRTNNDESGAESSDDLDVIPPSNCGQSNGYQERRKDDELAIVNGNCLRRPPVRQNHISESESDSDDVTLADFFNKNKKIESMRMPYTFSEDEEILKFVLNGENVYKTGSLSLWKELEMKKKNPTRTYQSLKNRFLRNIKPEIFHRFRHLLTEDSIYKLKNKFPELKKTSKNCAPTTVQSFRIEKDSEKSKTGGCSCRMNKLCLHQSSTNQCSEMIKDTNGISNHCCSHRPTVNTLNQNVRITQQNYSISDANTFQKNWFSRNCLNCITTAVEKKDASTLTDPVVISSVSNQITNRTDSDAAEIQATSDVTSSPSKAVESNREDVVSKNTCIKVNISVPSEVPNSPRKNCSIDMPSSSENPLAINLSVTVAGGNKDEECSSKTSEQQPEAANTNPAEQPEPSSNTDRDESTKNVNFRPKTFNKKREILSYRYGRKMSKKYCFRKIKDLSRGEKKTLSKLIKKLKEIEDKRKDDSSKLTQVEESVSLRPTRTPTPSEEVRNVEKTTERSSVNDAVPVVVQRSIPEAEENGSKEHLRVEDEESEKFTQESCSAESCHEFENSYAETYKKVSKVYQLIIEDSQGEPCTSSRKRAFEDSESEVSNGKKWIPDSSVRLTRGSVRRLKEQGTVDEDANSRALVKNMLKMMSGNERSIPRGNENFNF